MMHFTKYLVGQIATPLVLAACISVSATVCYSLRRRRAARWLLVFAATVVYVGAMPLAGNLLLKPLEVEYAPLRPGEPRPPIGYVVVLGSGYSPRDGIPVTAALDHDGLVRVVEGIRLLRGLGSAKLVVSGGAPPGQGRPALGYAELAQDLGVSASSLVVLDLPGDTTAEANAIARVLGSTPFIVVTSACHMPRAVRLLRRAGLHPIPAPTGQLTGSPGRWADLLPTSRGLQRTELALHEYIGLAALAAGIG
jgi:uncharacterized SAM-binding protein YcdF (DUF218 family)